ncbi:hypothetical protein HNP88_000085 [Methanococcus maripaludis]|uniref:Zinc dependent phospholipase C n=1 Tax=Methanococcus maripaludis TaxID=39152 RepID=A0A7J9NQZ7_METMI|nr:zinc dependent phospholipase C family protein [Methanococcus maripaludis]MBA2845901.1 hypothetical protein [Methanococcus maripaludis]
MPNLYSHLVLSKIFLEKKLLNVNENFDINNFYFGSCVPDIGYFSGIERKITHFYESDPEDLFENRTFFEKSFLKGYKLHIYLDNIWKYEIRLKNNISIEKNAEIYNYFDSFLENRFDVKIDSFESYIFKGNCEFLKKLNIEEDTCKNWKKTAFYTVSDFHFNEKYQKIIDSYLKILKIN